MSIIMIIVWWIVIGIILAVVLAPVLMLAQKDIRKKIEIQESIIYSEESTESEKNEARKELEKLKRKYKDALGK